MGINFDALPQEKPGVVPKGTYLGDIIDAKMQSNKTDPTKPAYLALTIRLHSIPDGKEIGKLFDNITESDNDYVRYKTKRFIEALGLQLKGIIELKDLAKIAKGKKMLVDTTIDDKSIPPRAVVDIFSGDIYYPLESAENGAINAPDAVDAVEAEAFDQAASTPTNTTY